MKKCLLALNLCVLFLTACRKDVPVLSPENTLLTFQIDAVDNVELISNDLICTVFDTLVVGVTGNNNSKSALVATFTSTGASVSVNGVTQVSGVTVNDFTNTVIYTVTAKNGVERKYAVKLKAFTGLPILYLTTEGPVESREDYVKGEMKIDGNLDFFQGLYNGKIEIRGRGNSTWFQLKRPYKIKLDKKSIILGMPADKEWALLANYFDKTLVRNDVAFELSERLGMAWTPRRRLVEVFINGNYNGNYLLTETVKTGTDRLNISVMNTKSINDTTGGFLVEANYRMDELQNWITPTEVRLSMNDPEVLSTVQFDYVKRQFLNMELNIGSTKDMRSDLDIDTWIKWTIVNEVMRNRDATLFGSCYFYKDSTNRIAMGPVWDADLSSGSYQGNVPEGWYINTANWLGGLFQYHPYYKQRFKEIWNANFKDIVSINKYIDDAKLKLQYSQKENFRRWDIMNASLFEGQIISGGYENEMNHLSDFLKQRIAWIDTQLNLK